jgi:hypothetical protein
MIEPQSAHNRIAPNKIILCQSNAGINDAKAGDEMV